MSRYTQNPNNNNKYGIADAINVNTANNDRNENLFAFPGCTLIMITDITNENNERIYTYSILFESNSVDTVINNPLLSYHEEFNNNI